MYKLGVILLLVLYLGGNIANGDIFSDAEFKKNLIECRIYCYKQDPKHDSEQTCKVFPDKQLILTDCEAQCLKLTKGKFMLMYLNFT